MRYLGLESSCDETALAVWESRRGIIYEQVLSQIELHRAYGGVVPGIAIREHLTGFQVLLKQIQQQIDLQSIDVIGVTHGPGLMGCLGVGLAYAQSLHWALRKPLVGINHLQGHALSPFIQRANNADFVWEHVCPHLGLLVSGGNTLLFEMHCVSGNLIFKILAQTQDDAAGEALDKGARLLGFPYPGGPFIEKEACKGDADFVHFPRAFQKKGEWKYSFSGLKTSLRYFLEKQSETWIKSNLASICAAYQAAVCDALTSKVIDALREKSYRSFGLSGGVSNNGTLRQKCQDIAQRHGIPLFLPARPYCGDNAAMIAFATSLKTTPNGFALNPNLTLPEA